MALLASITHGYSGPVHDKVSVGGAAITAGAGRDCATSSEIHAMSRTVPLMGNTPGAFNLDPYAFRPPSVLEGRKRVATPAASFERRQSRGPTPDAINGRPSTVGGGGQRTRWTGGGLGPDRTGGGLGGSPQAAAVRMHGGGLVEAGKLPRPRQEGPDLRFHHHSSLLTGQRAPQYAGEYTQRPGGSPDGSHRVAESFYGSPVRLAPVADVWDYRKRQGMGFATDADTVLRLESPEPPSLGTLPRMYQVQERIKFYMMEYVKDPSGATLRKLYAEELGKAGRDVRDKESLQNIEMAKLLAMNELGQDYDKEPHPDYQSDVPLPPYPTQGAVSALMHRDLEKEMLKERDALDAIAAAETAGNLEAADAMRVRLQEEHLKAQAAAAKKKKKKKKGGGSKSGSGGFGGDTPEPEPKPPASLGGTFSRGNLIKLLTEQSKHTRANHITSRFPGMFSDSSLVITDDVTKGS